MTADTRICPLTENVCAYSKCLKSQPDPLCIQNCERLAAWLNRIPKDDTEIFSAWKMALTSTSLALGIPIDALRREIRAAGCNYYVKFPDF